MTPTTIAYVGLGIMGKPASLHLLGAGHQLRVYARRPEAAQPLVDAGATAHSSAAEAAAEAQFAFTNVSDTPDVEEVVLGPGGLAEGMKSGGTIVDMSTIAPSAARKIGAELKDRGIDFIDAPVSGGQAGAENAALAFMCGGEQEAYDRVLPLLQAMGKNFVLVGGCGAGQIAKLCNQVIIAGTVNTVAEAFRVARRLGADPAKVRDAISGGFAGSKVLEVHAKRMIDNDFAPGFKARLHRKDIGIALDAAREAGVDLPSATVFAERLDQVIAQGHGDEDSSVACLALGE